MSRTRYLRCRGESIGHLWLWHSEKNPCTKAGLQDQAADFPSYLAWLFPVYHQSARCLEDSASSKNLHSMPSLELISSSLCGFWKHNNKPHLRPRLRLRAHSRGRRGQTCSSAEQQREPDRLQIKTSRRAQLLGTAGLFALQVPDKADAVTPASAAEPAPAADAAVQVTPDPVGSQGIQALRDPQINR